MALRSYSILDILLSSIIIITQDSSQALNTYKCLWSILWRCVWHAASPIDYLLFFITIYGVVYVQLAHLSIGDWKDISIVHVIIIIKSEVSTYPIVFIFFHGCVPEVFAASYSVTYCIYIPGKPGIWFH